MIREYGVFRRMNLRKPPKRTRAQEAVLLQRDQKPRLFLAMNSDTGMLAMDDATGKLVCIDKEV